MTTINYRPNNLICGLLLTVLSVLLAREAYAAIIVNGGFESDFTTSPNWTVTEAHSGALQRVATATALMDSRTLSPVEGSYFLMIKSDESAPTDTVLWQDVSLQAGDVVSGYMAIDAFLNSFRYADNDYAEVRVLQNTTVLFLKSLSVNQLNADRSLITWQFWSWTAPAAGTYRLELRAMDDSTKYGAMSWWGLFDGITVTSQPIPEPSTAVLVLAGLACGGTIALRNRIRRSGNPSRRRLTRS